MKQLRLNWIVIVAAFFVACNPYPRESERMAEAMEQAAAVYGDGNLLVEIDTALFIPGLAEASEYYAGKKQYAKAALAALYNGYTEKDFDKEAAMTSFKEAEHYGELANDSLTMARAEYWMGKFLHEVGEKEEALSMLNNSFSHIRNHCPERAVVENSLAVTFIMTKQFDSAEHHLQNSLIDAQYVNSERITWKALNNFAVLYRLQSNYEKSLEYLRKALWQPHLENTEKILVFLNLGNTFMAKGELDSAAYFFQRMENAATGTPINNDTRLSVYDALLIFAQTLDNDSLTLQYLEKHEAALYAVMSQQQKQVVFRIQKQYDYETLQNMMNQKIIRRHRIILLFGIMLLVMLIIILVLQLRHHRLLKAEEEMKRQLFSMKENLRQTVNTSVIDKVVISQLKTIIVANRAMSRARDPKNEWQPLLLKVMAGKEDAFEAAKTMIETVYPDMLSVIFEKYPNLNDTEARVCLMSCFDLTNAEIAELLDLSTNTVNQNRSTLRKKLNLGSEKMSEQLRNLIAK